jgi:hypothetical protein
MRQIRAVKSDVEYSILKELDGEGPAGKINILESEVIMQLFNYLVSNKTFFFL